MKNLSEQILRFKKLSGLINEDNKTGCVEGDCKNGTGKYVVSDGNYYEGEFKNGRFNGKGILYSENKKTADGRFIDGYLKYGKKFRYNGDEIFNFDEGEWDVNGLVGGGKRQYMGYGVENNNPRNIHMEEGTFKNGVLEKGTIEYENGKIFKGTFEYVGDKVSTKCLCCKKRDIHIRHFHCGHVIAKSEGGDFNVKNLRPICAQCNLSMGTMSMNEYTKTYFGYN